MKINRKQKDLIALRESHQDGQRIGNLLTILDPNSNNILNTKKEKMRGSKGWLNVAQRGRHRKGRKEGKTGLYLIQTCAYEPGTHRTTTTARK